MNTEKDILLRRIANHLILHSIDIEDIGLFHGKMGVVLFFAHYARYTDSAIYDDFAGELLEEICENIPETLPINLETGLCGIGWGSWKGIPMKSLQKSIKKSWSGIYEE